MYTVDTTYGSNTVYFTLTSYFGTRTSSSTTSTGTYTYCYTTTTTTLGNGVVVTPSECTASHASPWNYSEDWSTSTTCDRMSCYFFAKYSTCTSDWSCTFDYSTTRTCNINHPSTGLKISPCSSSNTTAWDRAYTAWGTDSTAATTTTGSSTIIEFKKYLYIYTRTDGGSTIDTNGTSTRSCTIGTSTHDYLTACETS